MDYTVYIASPQWRLRKSQYYRKYPRACTCCMATWDLHLHHLSYESMGNEPDDDLLCLCAPCHDVVHRYAVLRTDLTLAEATVFAIAHMRSMHVEARPKSDAPEVRYLGQNPVNVAFAQERLRRQSSSGLLHGKQEKKRIRDLRAWHRQIGI